MDLSSGQRSFRPPRPGVPRKPVGSGDTTRPNEEFNVLRMPAMYSQAVNPYPTGRGDASPSLTDTSKAAAGRDAFLDSTDSLEPYVDNGFYLGYATPYTHQQQTGQPSDPPQPSGQGPRTRPSSQLSEANSTTMKRPISGQTFASVAPLSTSNQLRNQTSPQDRDSSGLSRNSGSYLGTPFSDESSERGFPDRSATVPDDIYSSYEAEDDEYLSQGYSSAQNYTPTPPPFTGNRLSPQFSRDRGAQAEDARSSYSGREYSPTAGDYSPRQMPSRPGSSRDLFDVRSVASPIPPSRSTGSLASSTKVPSVPTVDVIDSATSGSSVYATGRASGSPGPSPLGERPNISASAKTGPPIIIRRQSQTRSLAAPSTTSSVAPPTAAPPQVPTQTPPSVPEAPTNQQLGIGVGSEYVQYVRSKAGETYSARPPAQLPRGLRGTGKSPALKVPPAFLRKAMDIRYTHLQPRMLASEVDDDVNADGDANSITGSVPEGSSNGPLPSGPLTTGSGLNLTTVRTDSGRSSRSMVATPQIGSTRQRSPSPVESVREGLGTIKLFVANPDE